MNEKELFINSIEEDIKHNGWRKWLYYLKFWCKYEEEMTKEEIEDCRDLIEYNYKKEEGGGESR